MTELNIVGYIAGIMTVIAFLPQVIKTYRSKDVAALSFLMYLFFNIGTFMWIIYGIIARSVPIGLFNTITFLLSFPVLLMIIKYDRRKNKKID